MADVIFTISVVAIGTALLRTLIRVIKKMKNKDKVKNKLLKIAIKEFKKTFISKIIPFVIGESIEGKEIYRLKNFQEEIERIYNLYKDDKNRGST